MLSSRLPETPSKREARAAGAWTMASCLTLKLPRLRGLPFPSRFTGSSNGGPRFDSTGEQAAIRIPEQQARQLAFRTRRLLITCAIPLVITGIPRGFHQLSLSSLLPRIRAHFFGAVRISTQGLFAVSAYADFQAFPHRSIEDTTGRTNALVGTAAVESRAPNPMNSCLVAVTKRKPNQELWVWGGHNPPRAINANDNSNHYGTYFQAVP